MNYALNIAGYVTKIVDGKPRQVPYPFPCCRCEAPSEYGHDGLKFCSTCWQERVLKERA